MALAVSIVGSFLAGWVAWTLAEYLLHRFDMHGRRGRGAMSREHLDHHAGRPMVPVRSRHGWAGAVLIAVAVGWWAVPAAGAGWLVGYAFYDRQHWSIHARPPRSRYQRWLRRNHLHHHFACPAANYGVTLPLWDMVFRTYVRPQTPIPLPRSLATGWLLDSTGDVRAELADEYVVVAPATD
jgi:sterol desaturase/sphingolipid hydroxylase (fatty acid hydroxylase superfamily)